MTDTEIIQALRSQLAAPGGRHLYGVLGSYPSLERFARHLQQARTVDGRPFPAPLQVNRGILDAIPDDAFRKLVEDEARYPEPTAAHVAQAFERFLRSHLQRAGLVVLAHLELLFAYNLELKLLRTLASDESRILLLLPARREAGRIIMFPNLVGDRYSLPANLIAENHLWAIRG